MLLLLACTAPSTPPADAPFDTDTSDTDTDTRDTSTDTSSPTLAGPCTTYAPAVAVGTVQDTSLDELSGLAVSRQNPGILWTHEDSGGAADLYALDASGATVATIHVDGVTNTDWEDLAIGECETGWCLVVGDIGDLGTDRADFSILIVEEPLLDGSPEWTLTPDVRPFTYPGDPEDAEALALTPDGVPLVVTKRANATAGIYRLPVGASELELLSEIPTGADGEDLSARVTAADLWHDPARLLVRTYFHLFELDATYLTAPGAPSEIDFALELQGEAVAWDPLQGGFWQVAEGAGPALNWTGCAE